MQWQGHEGGKEEDDDWGEPNMAGIVFALSLTDTVLTYHHLIVLCCPHQVYRMTSICLGTPPKSFDWEYSDKSKQYCKLSGLTPLQFYNEHVKPVYNPLDKVHLLVMLAYM